MAREVSEGRYLEEMPSCLRELFEQTSSEHQICIANNRFSSTKSFKSILKFNGMELPPPLLTEKERAEMRQYRREAVKCEARMFERRREKYSNLLLQVMSVMDRVQEQRERRTIAVMQYDTESVRDRTLAKEHYESTARTLVHRNNEEPTLYEPDQDRRYAWNASNDERNAKQKQFAKSYIDWTENNHHEYSRRINSQLSYLSHSLESSYADTDDQSEMYKHQLPRNENSQQQVRSSLESFEGADFPHSSTMNKEVTESHRPFSHLSLASHGTLDPGDVSDTTVHKSSVSLPFNRNVLDSDSLASTSVSVAFSDSSTSTVQSVIETQPRSTAPQLHILDSATNNTHYRHKEKQALPSMDQPPDYRTNERPVTSKQRTEKSKVQTATVSKDPCISEQDKTLANLEKLRKKLLEEKQKQVEALKQQELKRLRNQKTEKAGDLHYSYASFYRDSSEQVTERPRSSSLPSSRQSDFKQSPSEESHSNYVPHNRLPRTPPLRRPLSLPPGEMYSILELSGENLDFDTHTDNTNEPESSSDKENHVVDEVLRGNRNVVIGGIARTNAMAPINGEQNMYQRREPKHFVSGEDNKLFISNGRDKFAKLSAHAKGFLTRRLMKTDRVLGLVKTIKDTRDVLADISREDIQSVQEKMLKENVEGHLKVARSGLHDVFFKVPVKERMSYIANSRAIARAKEAKRRVTRSSVGQSKLSAVTLRAIQRRHEDHSVTQTANSELVKPKAEPREQKKKTWNIRVLKPQQGHTSPPLPDKTRSKKQSTRPATAPEKPLNSKTGKQDAVNRPKTTDNAHRNPPGLKRIGDENQAAKRPGRQSIGGAAQQPRITAQPRAKKRLSLPANAQPRIRGPGMTTDTVQRPKTASEVRRSSRLAANFSK